MSDSLVATSRHHGQHSANLDFKINTSANPVVNSTPVDQASQILPKVFSVTQAVKNVSQAIKNKKKYATVVLFKANSASGYVNNRQLNV